jgi:hypothetical protein
MDDWDEVYETLKEAARKAWAGRPETISEAKECPCLDL